MPNEEEIALRVKVAHPSVISLPANQTTGFAWEVGFCDPAIEYEELAYRRHRGDLGAGGTQRFQVKMERPGESVISFHLKRPWETEAREKRTYRVVATE